MRVFLDECVDWRLSRDLVGHQVIVLRAPTTRLAALRLLVPELLAAITSAKPGSATIVGSIALRAINPSPAMRERGLFAQPLCYA
jgi:hypothetical protein